MPRPPTGPQPNTSNGQSTTWISAVVSSMSDGSSMLPAPRTTAASTLVDQITSAPVNRTFEYASAASTAAPPRGPNRGAPESEHACHEQRRHRECDQQRVLRQTARIVVASGTQGSR